MKLSASRRRIAAALFFLAAAPGFGQDTAPASSSPIDAELKSLETAVSAYKSHVLAFLNKNDAPSSDQISCRRSFSLQGYRPANASPNNPYPREIYNYAACSALTQHSMKACDDLATVDPSGQSVVECRERVAQVRMSRYIRSGKPEAAGACREMIAVAATHMSNVLPPSKADEICHAFMTGRDRDDIMSQLRPLAVKRASPDEADELAHGIDLALGTGSCRHAENDGACQDIWSTARAARVDDPKECGASVLCRAAFVGESACAPLLSDACRTMFGVSSESLRSEYVTLSARIQHAVENAEMTEPRSDDGNKERIERAHRLRRRFDDVPKWGTKNKAR